VFEAGGTGSFAVLLLSQVEWRIFSSYPDTDIMKGYFYAEHTAPLVEGTLTFGVDVNACLVCR